METLSCRSKFASVDGRIDVFADVVEPVQDPFLCEGEGFMGGRRSGRNEIFTKAAKDEIRGLIQLVAEPSKCIYNLDVECDVATTRRVINESKSERIGTAAVSSEHMSR